MDDPLRLTNCPRCDYSLTGLAGEGICPECGRPYDGSTLYFYGDGIGGQQRLPTKSRVVFQSVWIVVWVGILMTQFGHFRGTLWRMPWLWGGVPSAVFGIAVTLWRSSTDQGSGAAQLKLSAAGVRLGLRSLTGVPYASNDEGTSVPWRKIREVRIEPLSGGRVRVVCSSRRRRQWFLPRTDYVDVVVRCPPEAVGVLRARVDRMRSLGLYMPERGPT